MLYRSVLCVIEIFIVFISFCQCPSYNSTNTQVGFCSEPAGNITLFGELTVNGDLIINGDFTVRNNLIVNGSLTITGDFIARSGSLTINNGGLVDIGDDLRPYNSNLSAFFDITIHDGGTLEVEDDFEATNLASLDVQEGGNVDVGGDFNSGVGSTTTIDGDFNVDGNFTNESFIADAVLEGDGNLTVGGTYTNNGNDDDFQGMINGNPLPIELVYFEGIFDGDDAVILSWLTSSEINNKGFELEKSLNGIDFATIDFIEGHGNTSEEHLYKYIDISHGFSEVFYRFKQIDFNGVFEYSPIIRVYSDLDKSALKVYPNPTTGKIELSSSVNNILLYDDQGKILIAVKNLERDQGQEIISKYLIDADEGVYFFSTIINGRNQQVKIVKK